MSHAIFGIYLYLKNYSGFYFFEFNGVSYIVSVSFTSSSAMTVGKRFFLSEPADWIWHPPREVAVKMQ